MAAAAHSCQHCAGHVANQITRNPGAAAEADTLMFNLILRLIVDVRKAQRTGLKTVFVCISTAGNHRTVQLRMVANVNIKAAFASEDPVLLLDRVVVALHLVAADAKAAATAARSPGVACTRIHTLLFAVVFVAILQAAEGQVAPDIRRDLIAVDLRAFKHRIAAASQVDVLSGIQRRFVPGGSIAFFAASGGVYAGRDGDARAIRTGGNTDPD